MPDSVVAWGGGLGSWLPSLEWPKAGKGGPRHLLQRKLELGQHALGPLGHLVWSLVQPQEGMLLVIPALPQARTTVGALLWLHRGYK